MVPDLKIRQEKIEEIYDVKEELGRGQFAVVKRCISKDTAKPVAAKFVKVKKTKASRNGLSREMVEREAAILSTLNHDKVLKLHDVFDLGIEMCLVLELLSGGELFDKISEQEFLTELEAGCYMKQVLEGIGYLHEKYIVHLDIKPENIVLKEKDKSDIKLVDFGLAQTIKPGEEIREMMGTPEFVAPEVVNYDIIGLYTDMWAIGVLAYILLSGCSPFLGDDNQETYANICAVDYHFDEEYFDNISEDAKLFVEELLIKVPSKRSTAQDCLDHPWMRNLSSPRARIDSTVIQTTRFKAFQARRRWQQSIQKVKSITRFSLILKLRASTAEEPPKDAGEATSSSITPKPAVPEEKKNNEAVPVATSTTPKVTKKKSGEGEETNDTKASTEKLVDENAASGSKDNEEISQPSKGLLTIPGITVSCDDLDDVDLDIRRNSSPNMKRRYSRSEEPVHYTELLRQLTECEDPDPSDGTDKVRNSDEEKSKQEEKTEESPETVKTPAEESNESETVETPAEESNESETVETPAEESNESETVETPAEKSNESETVETPAEDANESETVETPAEESNESETVETPAEESNESETVETPAEEANESETVETPGEDANESETAETPAEESNESETVETPAEESNESETVETPAEESNESETGIVELSIEPDIDTDLSTQNTEVNNPLPQQPSTMNESSKEIPEDTNPITSTKSTISTEQKGVTNIITTNATDGEKAEVAPANIEDLSKEESSTHSNIKEPNASDKPENVEIQSDTNDVVFTDITDNVKAFDIRDNKKCRISGRTSAVFNDEKAKDKETTKRSQSASEKRRSFILGQQTLSNDGESLSNEVQRGNKVDNELDGKINNTDDSNTEEKEEVTCKESNNTTNVEEQPKVPSESPTEVNNEESDKIETKANGDATPLDENKNINNGKIEQIQSPASVNTAVSKKAQLLEMDEKQKKKTLKRCCTIS